MRILVVTAVAAERAAVVAQLPDGVDVEVIAAGVGPAAAAAATAACIGPDTSLVLNVGIGGGFAPLAPGDVAIASAIAFADLGAESPTGFLPASELGFGTDRYDVDADLATALAEATGGSAGTVLTVATVTGTAASAAALLARYPDAVAEGMEGAGVAAAAAVRDVPVGELRAVSNVVGPRDRTAWQIPLALEALGRAVRAAVRTVTEPVQ